MTSNFSLSIFLSVCCICVCCWYARHYIPVEIDKLVWVASPNAYLNDTIMSVHVYVRAHLRAMKHFTYGCLRMANILHCMFHSVPTSHTLAYLCVSVFYSKYVAVFSIFNQFHSLIRLAVLKASLQIASPATESTPMPIFYRTKFNSHCMDCWFASNEMQIKKNVLLSWGVLQRLCMCVMWIVCLSRQ